MKEKLVMLLAAVILTAGTIFVTACVVKESPAQAESIPVTEEKQRETEEMRKVKETRAITEMNGFSFELMDRLLEQKAVEENLVVSPYSVWLCLAALTNGTEESAKEELFASLGYPGLTQEAFNEIAQKFNDMPVQSANALFVSQNAEITEAFESVYTREYEGGLFTVDFADPKAVGKINTWASEKTEGNIEKILESIDPDTRAAIANAVYFSDGWSTVFLEENTAESTFYGIKQNQMVPFMNHRFSELPYYETENMQAVILSTNQGGQLCLMLPKAGYSAEEVLATADQELLDAIQTAQRNTVVLSVPRFCVKNEPFSVLEQLQEMGIVITDREKNLLTQLVEGEALTISQAMHSAMLEVDEKGMTAAAVTVMGLMRMAMPRETEPIELVFEKPFAFLLTMNAEEMGSQVLFGGVVNHIE